MEPTYTILGADNAQYGPVTADELRAWIRDGRVVGATQIWRSDTPNWVAASALPELGIAAPTAVAAGVAQAPITHPSAGLTPELEKRIRSGASWFYWIAGFSVINTVTLLSGSNWGFALGLGITRLFDVFALNSQGGAKIFWLALDFGTLLALVFLGFLAGKRHTWAFLAGLILLALDSVLTGFLQMWISLALHVFALFAIFAGFKACRASRA
ncbi:MAG TPA: DUF4339 domain-containing protein [Methylomirabilota bacterium]|nr:DUF4339 domain-containing protein [Methylomirabilota bacterium]